MKDDRSKKVWVCQHCSGFFTSAGSVSWLLSLEEKEARSYSGGYTVVTRKEDVTCPVCAVPMTASSPSGVVEVTKTCPDCRGVWWRQGSYGFWRRELPVEVARRELLHVSDRIEKSDSYAEVREVILSLANQSDSAPSDSRLLKYGSEVRAQAYLRAIDLANEEQRAVLAREFGGFEQVYRYHRPLHAP